MIKLHFIKHYKIKLVFKNKQKYPEHFHVMIWLYFHVH
jgi:hypothetical protein